MRISGFTIVRNAIKFNYPALESIQSILPICDEFIVNIGDSDDETLSLIQSINSPKIKIIQTCWNMGQGPRVLSEQTNIALNECSGDWAFYLQTDEVIHEADLTKLKFIMEESLYDSSVDALRFKWLHFYGSFWRYRIDLGWYQKQDRIIRNNKTIESYGDAFAFKRKDGKPLKSRSTGCLLYHYGWVNSKEEMMVRTQNAAQIGYGDEQKKLDGYGNLERFPVYFGTHPAVMQARITQNEISNIDGRSIRLRHWWNPLLWFRIRYKTGRRIKTAII